VLWRVVAGLCSGVSLLVRAVSGLANFALRNQEERGLTTKEYWGQRSAKFGAITLFVDAILSTIASEAMVERTFQASSHLVGPMRSKLDVNLMNDQLFIACNARRIRGEETPARRPEPFLSTSEWKNLAVALVEPFSGGTKTRHAAKVEEAVGLRLGDRIEVKFMVTEGKGGAQHDVWWHAVVTHKTQHLGEYWVTYELTEEEKLKDKKPRVELFKPLTADTQWRLLSDS